MTKPSLTQLYRFSRELEPASAQLSADLTAAFDAASSAAHRRSDASRRIAGRSRRWRGVAALAASLVVAIALWNTHRTAAMNDVLTAQIPAMITPANDRIFAALDAHAVAAHSNRGDEIFRGEFVTDEIFKSKTHGG